MLTALVLPVLLAVLPGPPQELRFAPREGSSVTRLVERRSELALDTVRISLDGTDLSDAAAALDYTLTNELTLRLTDTFASLDPTAGGGAVVAGLERRFDEIESLTRLSIYRPRSPLPPAVVARGVSPLQGTAVRFERDSGDEPHRASFASGAPADAATARRLLAELRCDLTFHGLLPATGVDLVEGAQWSVPAGALAAALLPGGDLRLQPASDQGTGMSPLTSLATGIATHLGGEVIVELGGAPRGERPARGRVLRLQFELASAWEEGPEGIAAGFQPSLPEGADFEPVRLRPSYRLVGSGEAVWDTERNLLARLELEGDVVLAVEQEGRIRMADREQELAQTLRFTGTERVRIGEGP